MRGADVEMAARYGVDPAVRCAPARDDERVLTDEECAALAQMGQKLARLHGCPQDIEWAFDADGDLYLLQSRPITTI